MSIFNWSSFIFINFIDNFITQLIVLYVIYLFFFSRNIFYTIFYFFTLVFYVGVILCIYQLDLFVGFLWLVECVVIFVFLLLLFYIQVTSTWNSYFLSTNLYVLNGVFILWIFTLSLSSNFVVGGFINAQNINEIYYYDDFYEASLNTNINDFISFLISYYSLNSFNLIILGFLILIASIICVNLNKFIKGVRVQNYSTFFNIFNLFKNNVNFSFMRQQNLVDQESNISSTRIFKKKLNL